MILGVHHIGVATRDLDRLSSFYMRHFDGRILNEFSWDEHNTALSLRLGLDVSSGRLAMVGFVSARIEIFEFSTPKIDSADTRRSVAKPGFSHICFQVDDCQKEYERLVDLGMDFHAQPLVMPTGGIFAYGRDPDGNVVEILQPPNVTV